MKGSSLLCCGVGELVWEGVGGITSATIREATLGLQFSPRINNNNNKEDF